MTLLLDVAPAIFLFIPFIVIALVIIAVGAGVFFLVRAIMRKNAEKAKEAER
ncbi:MAG TPA: hypothetical protein PK438_07865 [Clostridia bacterium]|jgi:NADH:ubiquinone oxidoreductase subunit 3 (subunit A)|nr:MAG: hypothetical protein BWY35_00221 [Firmicutes bacterium ADurb.Bin248]HOF99478.1 hypothetical protein [Clostridia bacterium]HOS19190.1 hypothetical protein [Clostridia bacterium]HPK15171.1 hypothetical protein [Clostridia bacterium]